MIKNLRLALLVSSIAGVLAVGPAPFLHAQGYEPGSMSAQDTLSLRVSDLEQQIRTLTDQVERKDFEVRTLRTDLDRLQKVVNDLQSAAPAQPAPQSFETPAADAPKQTGAVREPTIPADVPPTAAGSASAADYDAPYKPATATPELGEVGEKAGGAVSSKMSAAKDYDTAYAALQAGQYAEAESKFAAFLKTYPDHALASNAQYWIGEAQYTQNKFPDAARSFAKNFKTYPKGQKAPDSLLKLAATLDKMGKGKDACLTLTEMKTRFPEASPALLKRASDESSRLACTSPAATAAN